MNAAAEQPYLPNELSRISTYESVNPDSDIAVCSVMETGSIPELIGSILNGYILDIILAHNL